VLSTGMRRDDGVGDEPRRVELDDVLRQPPLCSGNRSDRVGDCDTLKQRIGEDGGCLSHKEAVRRRCENPRCPSLAAAPCGALQGRAGADQIIEYDYCAIAHIADQELAGDGLAAAPLLDESGRRLVMQLGREGAAKLLGPLGAADVGRNDGDFFMSKQPGEMVDKERDRFEIRRLTAKGVLESG